MFAEYFHSLKCTTEFKLYEVNISNKLITLTLFETVFWECTCLGVSLVQREMVTHCPTARISTLCSGPLSQCFR